MEKHFTSVLTFLCKMPGIFLVTLFGLALSLGINYDRLDASWWFPVLVAIAFTFVINFYLMSTDEDIATNKILAWIPLRIIFNGFSTVMLIYFFFEDLRLNWGRSEDYSITATITSCLVTVLWGWFALWWNVCVLPYNEVSKTNKVD